MSALAANIAETPEKEAFYHFDNMLDRAISSNIDDRTRLIIVTHRSRVNAVYYKLMDTLDKVSYVRLCKLLPSTTTETITTLNTLVDLYTDLVDIDTKRKVQEIRIDAWQHNVSTLKNYRLVRAALLSDTTKRRTTGCNNLYTKQDHKLRKKLLAEKVKLQETIELRNMIFANATRNLPEWEHNWTSKHEEFLETSKGVLHDLETIDAQYAKDYIGGMLHILDTFPIIEIGHEAINNDIQMHTKLTIDAFNHAVNRARDELSSFRNSVALGMLGLSTYIKNPPEWERVITQEALVGSLQSQPLLSQPLLVWPSANSLSI